jgi:hypothetical protein
MKMIGLGLVGDVMALRLLVSSMMVVNNAVRQSGETIVSTSPVLTS